MNLPARNASHSERKETNKGREITRTDEDGKTAGGGERNKEKWGRDITTEIEKNERDRDREREREREGGGRGGEEENSGSNRGKKRYPRSEAR